MSAGTDGLTRGLGPKTATALVIANIIGAGIFTTTGFQAEALGHPGIILLLWFVGGLLALCGALCYGELGAMMPRAGAEYAYLRETYGPAFGFMSAFISLVAGFSAPIAAAVMALTAYLTHFIPSLDPAPKVLPWLTVNDLIALGLVWSLVGIHRRGLRGGFAFNNAVTLFKVAGIMVIILTAAAVGRGNLANLTHVSDSYHELNGGQKWSAMATSLVFVMYGYLGWNAAAYIGSEIDRPRRNLPLSLLLGTGAVMALYLGLNAVYLYGADVDALAREGRPEVGLAAARRLFGPSGAKAMTGVILISLLASASAMTIAGPRVYYALGRDWPALGFLAKVNPKTGAPSASLLLQGSVTSLLILSGRIDRIMLYSGLTLTLFACLAVSCVIVLRARRPDEPRPFRVPLYPLPPLLFLTASAWMMVWMFRDKPKESLAGLATVLIGGGIYYLISRGRGPSSAQ